MCHIRISLLFGATGGKWLLLKRQLTCKPTEDAADASFVQTRSIGDLFQGQPLATEMQQLMMAGRAKGEHLLPQFVRLDNLAGSGLNPTR